MKIDGTYTISAPRQNVWDVMLDPLLLAQVLPGCEALEPLGDDRYKARVKIHIGPLQGVFEGTIALSDIQVPESYRLGFDGKGTLGFVKGSGSVTFSEKDGTTQVAYAGDAAVGGRIATVGQRLMETSARALIEETFDLVTPLAQAKTPPTEASTADGSLELSATPIPTASSHSIPVKAQPPSQTKFALGIVRHMFNDTVPPEYRLPVLVVGAALLLVILRWLTSR